jgi:ABC-type transporter Mla subunit MlaD
MGRMQLRQFGRGRSFDRRLVSCFAYSRADLRKVQGVSGRRQLSMVDGLKEGGDVKVNGVKIGSNEDLRLITVARTIPVSCRSQTDILPEVLLPTDTIAMVASESLWAA